MTTPPRRLSSRSDNGLDVSYALHMGKNVLLVYPRFMPNHILNYEYLMPFYPGKLAVMPPLGLRAAARWVELSADGQDQRTASREPERQHDGASSMIRGRW